MPGDANRVVPSPHEPGVYYVDRDTWQVGARYELQKVIGMGSFSAVCLAQDNLEGDKVAMKRVGDVFASPDNAKRVLREVCIMRRLEHPNVIRLRDVFLKPSPTGKYVFRGGRLVPTSYDCYMALEYCDQGDLFNMRGQLPEHEVRSLMWQLLSALRYLHGLNVWHRDIKTGNLLLTLHEGRRVLKVADFGSARSAKDATMAANGGPASAERLQNGGDPHGQPPLESFDGMELEDEEVFGGRGDDLGPPSARCGVARQVLRPGVVGSAPSRAGGGLMAVPAPEGGYQAPLTSLVCTPCYRAPEVVMSRGGYSSAIDMWSAGCVFGELLQRTAYVGKASTPHLQVAPVFAITGKPLTPNAGQRYGAVEPGGSTSATAELSALFAVIGTPAWACIEAVRSEAWRRFLYRIPGRAPTLHRRFNQAGEVAVDLLARLLQFDPGRRASAEEAMAHEYFAMMHMEAQMAATGLAHEKENWAAGSRGRRSSQSAVVQGHKRRSTTSLFARSGTSEDDAEDLVMGVRPAASSRSASATGAVPPLSAAAAAPPPLPTWPPGRGPSRRCSGAGSREGEGDREPSSDMEVEAEAEVEVEKGGEGRRGRGGEGADPGTGDLAQLSPTSVSPNGRLLGSRGSAGGCSLLTKRKQLEDAGEEQVPERQPPPPLPGQEQQPHPQPHSLRQAGGTNGVAVVARAGGVAYGQGQGQGQADDARNGNGCLTRRSRSFWQIDEPALALAALEAELAHLVPPDAPTSSDVTQSECDRARAATASQTPEALAALEECKERLREMLERECAEHSARAAAVRGAMAVPRGPRSSGGGGGGGSGIAGSGGSAGAGAGSFRRNLSEGVLVGADGQMLGGAAGAAALHGHLRPDPGQQLDPSIIGYERVPYHADAAAARLEPEKHLWAGRHGEWTQSSLASQRREASAGTWGVTLMPPGLDEGTAAGRAYIDVMRSQQAR